MSGKVLMIQGTASSVGKSIMVTALCRILRQEGHKVAPFKSQNMSLNSFVTGEGGEIGRAQAVQAEAAGIEPSVQMNPVLLKPEADAACQVIVLGKVDRRITAVQYYEYTPYLLDVIHSSLESLRAKYDIIVIEGAGSPAEINLHDREIVNMRIARMARAPVLLVGDIDRGGVFASLVGTLELLNGEERGLVRGLVINKFRGDVSLLEPGLAMLEQRTGKPVLGVIPYLKDLRIAREDSVYFDERKPGPDSGDLDIAVIHLPHISNFDDFDPLSESGCRLRYVTSLWELGTPDLIILPGTKSTINDLNLLRQKGLDRAVIAGNRNGIPVIGICGGYQMLGKMIYDPDGVESTVSTVPGLSLLNVSTTFQGIKTTSQVKGRLVAKVGMFEDMSGAAITGYEIHMGHTGTDGCQPVFQITRTPGDGTVHFDGAIDASGLVFGTYLHGLFHNREFTNRLLDFLRKRRHILEITAPILPQIDPYDELADAVRDHLDMNKIYRILAES